MHALTSHHHHSTLHTEGEQTMFKVSWCVCVNKGVNGLKIPAPIRASRGRIFCADSRFAKGIAPDHRSMVVPCLTVHLSSVTCDPCHHVSHVLSIQFTDLRRKNYINMVDPRKINYIFGDYYYISLVPGSSYHSWLVMKNHFFNFRYLNYFQGVVTTNIIIY